MKNFLGNKQPAKWLLLVVVIISSAQIGSSQNISNTSRGPSEIARIVRSIGFIAEDHRLVTRDGYILTLVRILNPIINEGRSGLPGKRSILFVPGESASGSVFLAGYERVEPKDLSKLDIHDEQVQASLASSEESTRVLPLLSSNRGHEVWILNRRATPDSLGHILYKAYLDNPSTEIGTTDPPVSQRCTSDDPEAGDYETNKELLSILEEYASESVDTRYWDYSLDQQGQNDLPQACQYVLDTSEQEKLALVGWSTGTSLILMMLINEPTFNGRVSNAILLAPTFYRTYSANVKTNAVQPALSNYTGPFQGQAHITNQVRCLIDRACYEINGTSTCDASDVVPSGRIGNRETTNQELMRFSRNPVSSSQMVQLQQNRGRPLHRLDHNNVTENLIAYGQTKPPVYDLGRISLRTISIWHGPFDQMSKDTDINRLIADFRVPIEFHEFNASDIYFDHSSVIFHRQVNTLINLPALDRIERY